MAHLRAIYRSYCCANPYLLAARVYPGPARPYCLKREGTERGVYIRVGSTNRRADSEMVAELARFSRGEGFDEQAVPHASPEAIDFRAASESFSSSRKLKRSDLATLRLVTTHQGRQVPTVGGILLFGKHRDHDFPDAWIQAGRFRGTDKSTITDQREIRDYLPLAIEEAIAYVERHSLHGAVIGSGRRQDLWSLPPVAVREAIVNAVAHADYAQRGAPLRISVFDDRLEVENPGLLPFGLTVADLPRGISKLRNRVIGRVLHEIGLMEHWGSGVQRMTAACHDAGLAPPVFEEIGIRFRVTLTTARTPRPPLPDKDRKILEALAEGRGLLTSELAGIIGLTPRATRTRLARLVDHGLVIVVGKGAQDPQRRYFLTSE